MIFLKKEMDDSVKRLNDSLSKIICGKSTNEFMTLNSAIDNLKCYAEPTSHWERMLTDKDDAIKILCSAVLELCKRPTTHDIDVMRERIVKLERNNKYLKYKLTERSRKC